MIKKLTDIECPNCGRTTTAGCRHCTFCSYYREDENRDDWRVIDLYLYDLGEYKKVATSIDPNDEDAVFQIAKQMCREVEAMLMDGAVKLTKEVASTGVIPKFIDRNKYKMTDGFMIRQKEERLSCPRCGSHSVAIGTRGYSVIWGFSGSSRTVNRCGACGYRWKPRQ